MSTMLLHKGLKGKGAAIRWRKDLLDTLRHIHGEMKVLREQSKAIDGKTFYLDLYRRTVEGAATLRWRFSNGQHTTWRELTADLACMPQRLSDFYREANELALLLNAQESAARYALKQALKLENCMENHHA